MNYPLIKTNKKGNLLRPTHSSYSDDYARRMCDLYLSDEMHKNEDGNLSKYYRLHAKDAHSQEMAFAYDIKCPHCSSNLKQVGRVLDYNNLGLYACKTCDNQ